MEPTPPAMDSRAPLEACCLNAKLSAPERRGIVLACSKNDEVQNTITFLK
jgi:hypothetical protein